VLDELFQYYQACDKLLKSHLSRSSMFLDLVQSFIYIYYHNLMCPAEWVLLYCFCLVTKALLGSEMFFVSNIPHTVDTVQYAGN